MNIKETLESIKTTLEIILILKPVLKLACTKAKKYFYKRKKSLLKQIKNKENTIFEYIGMKLTIVWI